jgi:hypothetical protein
VIEGAAALALAASLRDGRGGRHLVVLSGAGIGERDLHAILAPAAGAEQRRDGAGDADGP